LAPKFTSRVASRPIDAVITTNTHFSSIGRPLSRGRWPDTDDKKMRKAASSKPAEIGSNIRQCQPYTPASQRNAAPTVHNAQHVQAAESAKGFIRRNFGME